MAGPRSPESIAKQKATLAACPKKEVIPKVDHRTKATGFQVCPTCGTSIKNNGTPVCWDCGRELVYNGFFDECPVRTAIYKKYFALLDDAKAAKHRPGGASYIPGAGMWDCGQNKEEQKLWAMLEAEMIQTHVRVKPDKPFGPSVPSWIYAFADKANTMVKIGMTTKSPEWRLKQCQTGCPVELRVIAQGPGGCNEEHAIHALLADYRWHYVHSEDGAGRGGTGREWFELSASVIYEIEALDMLSVSNLEAILVREAA
jgi:hypothetical protein